MDETVESLKAALAVERARAEKAEAERDEARRALRDIGVRASTIECGAHHGRLNADCTTCRDIAFIQSVTAGGDKAEEWSLRHESRTIRDALAAAQKRIETLKRDYEEHHVCASNFPDEQEECTDTSLCGRARAALASPSESGPRPSQDQIEYMVGRFLNWRLPADFSPDAGISFKATFNEHTAHPMKHNPTGTNLFDATQATAMVRHMIDGMPAALAPQPTPETRVDLEALTEAVDQLDAFLKIGEWPAAMWAGANRLDTAIVKFRAALARRAAPTGQQQEAGALELAAAKKENSNLRKWLQWMQEGMSFHAANVELHALAALAAFGMIPDARSTAVVSLTGTQGAALDELRDALRGEPMDEEYKGRVAEFKRAAAPPSAPQEGLAALERAKERLLGSIAHGSGPDDYWHDLLQCHVKEVERDLLQCHVKEVERDRLMPREPTAGPPALSSPVEDAARQLDRWIARHYGAPDHYTSLPEILAFAARIRAEAVAAEREACAASLCARALIYRNGAEARGGVVGEALAETAKLLESCAAAIRARGPAPAQQEETHEKD